MVWLGWLDYLGWTSWLGWISGLRPPAPSVECNVFKNEMNSLCGHDYNWLSKTGDPNDEQVEIEPRAGTRLKPNQVTSQSAHCASMLRCRTAVLQDDQNHLCASMRLSVYECMHPSIHPSICPWIRLSIRFMPRRVDQSMCLAFYPSTIIQSLHSCIHPPIHPPTSVRVCLCVSPSF